MIAARHVVISKVFASRMRKVNALLACSQRPFDTPNIDASEVVYLEFGFGFCDYTTRREKSLIFKRYSAFIIKLLISGKKVFLSVVDKSPR